MQIDDIRWEFNEKRQVSPSYLMLVFVSDCLQFRSRCPQGDHRFFVTIVTKPTNKLAIHISGS